MAIIHQRFGEGSAARERREIVFGYEAASHCWRVMPLQLAEWAWRRRGRSLIRRIARSVPAYGHLLRVFGGSPAIGSSPGHIAPPQTCRRSYVQVFPLQQRCRKGWRPQATTFDAMPANSGTGLQGAWPRQRDERRILRQQLVSLLVDNFSAARRRTLLVLALPEGGWSGRRRIGQALHEAIGLGRLPVSLIEPDEPGADVSMPALHLGKGFEQCIVMATPASAVVQALWLANCKGRTGLVSLGPLPTGVAAALPREIRVCSVLGADEVAPLIALQTPLARMVLDVCRTDPTLCRRLLGGAEPPLAIYQPLPRGPWIEHDNGYLLVSSWGAAPVARYRLGWRGQVVPFARACDVLRQPNALPPAGQIRRLTAVGSACWKLPLVALDAM
jgi:hypothetical protein